MDDTEKNPTDLDGHTPFSEAPVEITISVGKARPMVRELLQLKRDAVLQLDKRIDDPVELFIGNKLIARGELEELTGAEEGQLAVRLTEVADLKPGL